MDSRWICAVILPHAGRIILQLRKSARKGNVADCGFVHCRDPLRKICRGNAETKTVEGTPGQFLFWGIFEPTSNLLSSSDPRLKIPLDAVNSRTREFVSCVDLVSSKYFVWKKTLLFWPSAFCMPVVLVSHAVLRFRVATSSAVGFRSFGPTTEAPNNCLRHKCMSGTHVNVKCPDDCDMLAVCQNKEINIDRSIHSIELHVLARKALCFCLKNIQPEQHTQRTCLDQATFFQAVKSLRDQYICLKCHHVSASLRAVDSSAHTQKCEQRLQISERLESLTRNRHFREALELKLVRSSRGLRLERTKVLIMLSGKPFLQDKNLRVFCRTRINWTWTLRTFLPFWSLQQKKIQYCLCFANVCVCVCVSWGDR